MRILAVSSSLTCGGAERVLTTMLNYWADSGCEVSVITLDHGEAPFFDLDSRVVREPLLKTNIRSIFFVRKILAIFHLRKLILRSSPSVVISFQDKVNIFVLLSLLGTSIKVVVSERNHPEYRPLSLLYRFLRKLLYMNADKLVVQTEDIEACFSKLRRAKKTVIIKNPLTLSLQSAIEGTESPVVRPCIVGMGRLVPQKGFVDQVRMFREVCDEFPGWKLYIIGDGMQYLELSNMIKDYGLSDRVCLVGKLDDPFYLLSQADIFLFTSQYEGFPNALAEAMALGRACISYNCPSGPSELITNGVNGVLVSLGDRETFLKKLRCLMMDREERGRLGKNAEKVVSELSTAAVMKKWECLLSEVISNG